MSFVLTRADVASYASGTGVLQRYLVNDHEPGDDL